MPSLFTQVRLITKPSRWAEVLPLRTLITINLRLSLARDQTTEKQGEASTLGQIFSGILEISVINRSEKIDDPTEEKLLLIIGPCDGNSSVIGEFPSQRAINGE